MDDHPRVRKKRTDVKVRIRKNMNVFILSGMPGERKANAEKICAEKRPMIS